MKPTFLLINEYSNPFAPSKDGDVGHDLYVSLADAKLSWLDKLLSEFSSSWVTVAWPFRSKLLPSGIRVSLDSSTWCQIASRSSASKRGFMVISGIIDSGYQGELYTNIYNFGLLPKIVRHGERLSQVIFYPAVRPYFKRVSEFRYKTQRGATGFGSTGS